MDLKWLLNLDGKSCCLAHIRLHICVAPEYEEHTLVDKSKTANNWMLHTGMMQKQEHIKQIK